MGWSGVNHYTNPKLAPCDIMLKYPRLSPQLKSISPSAYANQQNRQTLIDCWMIFSIWTMTSYSQLFGRVVVYIWRGASWSNQTTPLNRWLKCPGVMASKAWCWFRSFSLRLLLKLAHTIWEVLEAAMGNLWEDMLPQHFEQQVWTSIFITLEITCQIFVTCLQYKKGIISIFDNLSKVSICGSKSFQNLSQNNK